MGNVLLALPASNGSCPFDIGKGSIHSYVIADGAEVLCRKSNVCAGSSFDFVDARVQTEKEANALMASTKHCIRQDRRALIEAGGKVALASIYSISLIAFGKACLCLLDASPFCYC